MKLSHTSKSLGFLCRHGAKVPQIALITNKHNDDVGIRVVSQLLQPSSDILVGVVLGDIVNQESTDSASVVSRSDRSITFLSSSIPNLGLDRLGINLNGTSRKLDTDSGFRVEVELVPGESTEKVGFTDAGVSDQDDCMLLVSYL